MKKLLFLFVVMSFIPLLNIAQSIKNREDAINLVRKVIQKDSLDNLNIYISMNPIDPKSNLKVFNRFIVSPNYTSWFVFIDDMPNKSWTHPCRYLFINLQDGEIEIVKGKFPPNTKEMYTINYVDDGTETIESVFKEGKLLSKSSDIVQTLGNKYAVIISGGMDETNNWRRYWNDCSAIYRCLVYRFGFTDANIYVLMSDGTDPSQDRRIGQYSYDSSPLDLDGDGDEDIDYSATNANISTVFNTLASQVTQNDYVYVFSTDHGNQISGWDAELILWGETITDKLFAKEIDKINQASSISIVMEQCYSGGFIDDLQSGNRIIATACAYDETSCGSGTYTFDEFVHHWTAGVNGSYPDGTPANADINNDGFVTMQEAFNYAQNNDGCTENPQYSCLNQNYGNVTTMGGLQLCSTTNEIKDETISTNMTYSHNCKIRIQNITISNNSIVTFDAGLDIKITGPFLVQSGSKLILQ